MSKNIPEPEVNSGSANINPAVNPNNNANVNQQQLVQQMMQQNNLTEEKKAQITMLTDMG